MGAIAYAALQHEVCTMSVPRALNPGRFDPQALFRPRSVAVIGAACKAGAQVMGNLLAGGFQGAILPVLGPFAERVPAISGVLAYPDIASLPIAPDLAVICLDTPDAGNVCRALAKRGTHAAVMIGMSEGVGQAVAETGVRVLGPGSFGISVPGIGLQATRSHLLPRPGRVALVSQSAALCRAVLDWAEPNGVGFSHVLGVGGNTDLGFAVMLDWLSRDAGTGAILMDIRLIRDRRMFLSGARAASRMRPVVAMRAGGLLRDPTGAQDAAFEAALRRAGVLVVDRLEDMLAAAETLTRARPARGEGLVIVTNAIGPGQMAADAAVRDGLSLARLSDETRDVIRLAVPRAFGGMAAQIGNGAAGELVYVGTDSPMKLAEVAALLSGAAEVGGVLAVHAPTGDGDDTCIAALAAAAAGIRAPLLACVMGETTGAAHRRALAAAGVPVFATPEQAVRGFHHLVQNRRNQAAARELPSSAVLTIAPDQDRVRAILTRSRKAGALSLPPEAARAVLEAYGVVFSAELAGGLRALRVAVRDDATFGPVIVFGQGGAEGVLFKDHAVDLPPLNLPLAHGLIGRTTISSLLGAEDQVADLLVRVSQLIVDFPEIASLDIDPVLAGDAGIRAGQAMITLRQGTPERLALPPYPAELAGSFTSQDEVFTIRPIRPEDAQAHGAFFSRLSPEDVRFRFFTTMRELSPEQMARMTQVDYEREMAFVATRPGQDGAPETVGVARLVRDAPEHGEFAVVVQPDMKGRGLAGHLMQRLIDWGRSQQLVEIVGQVLAENKPMLHFVRKQGFTIHHLPDEPDVVEARLRL